MLSALKRDEYVISYGNPKSASLMLIARRYQHFFSPELCDVRVDKRDNDGFVVDVNHFFFSVVLIKIHLCGRVTKLGSRNFEMLLAVFNAFCSRSRMSC